MVQQRSTAHGRLHKASLAGAHSVSLPRLSVPTAQVAVIAAGVVSASAAASAGKGAWMELVVNLSYGVALLTPGLLCHFGRAERVEGWYSLAHLYGSLTSFLVAAGYLPCVEAAKELMKRHQDVIPEIIVCIHAKVGPEYASGMPGISVVHADHAKTRSVPSGVWMSVRQGIKVGTFSLACVRVPAGEPASYGRAARSAAVVNAENVRGCPGARSVWRHLALGHQLGDPHGPPVLLRTPHTVPVPQARGSRQPRREPYGERSTQQGAQHQQHPVSSWQWREQR